MKQTYFSRYDPSDLKTEWQGGVHPLWSDLANYATCAKFHSLTRNGMHSIKWSHDR